jgi:hypothetical protein
MLNESEKIYLRDTDTYIYSDAAGSITIVGTSITLPATVIPNYNEGFTMLTDKKILFRDTGLYLYSSTDGTLNVVADTVLALASTTITLTGAVTITGAVSQVGAITMSTTSKINFYGTTSYINASADGALVVAATTLGITAATTHTGALTMASTSKIQFLDTGLYIYSSTNGQLDIVADTVLALASTDITLTGAVTITGAPAITGNVTIAGTVGITGDVTMATTDQINFYDTGAYIQASASTALAIVGTTIALTGAITNTGAVSQVGALTMATTSKLQFHDTGMYIYASGDGALAVVSDTTLGVTCPAITLTASTSVTVAGILAISDATDASAVGTASAYTAGGFGVTKKLYVGTDLVMVGGDIDFATATTGLHDIILKDNLVDALSIRDDAADLMVFTTTTGADKVAITPNLYCGAAITSTGHMHPKTTVTALTSGATVTYTAAQMVNCMISDHPSEACAATTHTATQIIAAIPNAVDGSQFWFILKNAADDASTITLTEGADVTITGTATVAQNNTKLFFGIVTSVASHTVTIYSTGTMVH